jgi:hypothetical protein
MRYATVLLSLLLLATSVGLAGPTKTDCKAYSQEITRLTKLLKLSPELTGRALLNAVEQWIESQEQETIKQVIGEVEAATEGVRQCEAHGFSSRVMSVKAMSVKMETAVLPWLRNASDVDPCQTLISQAARKRYNDVDGAIADLERSVTECTDDVWLPDAHLNLAAMYYQRGDLEQNDYEKARVQTREAMKYGETHEEENRKAFRAILAKPTIEAGWSREPTRKRRVTGRTTPTCSAPPASRFSSTSSRSRKGRGPCAS